MRVMATGVAIALVMGVSLVAQEKKVPKDSFRVTVPGCIKGMVFTAGPRTEDQPGRLDVPEGIHLRMNGPKKLIAEIRGHEGQMIQITGLMKKGQYNQQGFPVGGFRPRRYITWCAGGGRSSWMVCCLGWWPS